MTKNATDVALVQKSGLTRTALRRKRKAKNKSFTMGLKLTQEDV